MFRDRLGRLEVLVKRLANRRDCRPLPPRRLRTADDVIALIEEQSETLRAATTLAPVERARALAYLAGVARKAIETGTLAARLEAMEQILKYRSPPRP